MKTQIALLFMASIKFWSAESSAYPRGCIYADGRCIQECEEGTHAYSIGCGYKTPEATCDDPFPEPESALICDYSACHCNEPTVRDTDTDQCVLLYECSGFQPCLTIDCWFRRMRIPIGFIGPVQI